MKQKIYLESTPLPDALNVWLARLRGASLLQPLSGEKIAVINSLGRVSAAAVSAKISSPFYHSAAMDGYAVKFAETVGASETAPVRLKVGKQAIPVDTGDPV